MQRCSNNYCHGIFEKFSALLDKKSIAVPNRSTGEVDYFPDARQQFCSPECLVAHIGRTIC